MRLIRYRGRAGQCDRLDRFDDVFTEILIGLALAILIAIGFAPVLVNLRDHDWQAWVKHDGKAHLIELADWPGQLTCAKDKHPFFEPTLRCPVDGSVINNEDLAKLVKGWKHCVVCGSQVPAEVNMAGKKELQQGGFEVSIEKHVSSLPSWLEESRRAPDWKERWRFYSIIALWVSMCLFCIKLIHEQSAMRYHLSKDDLVLPEDGISSNFLLFLSRVFLLAFLYLFVIQVYVRGWGEVGNSNNRWLMLVLFAAYILPDLILYRRLLDLRGSRRSSRTLGGWLRDDVVWRWLLIDLLNLFAGIVMFFSSFEVIPTPIPTLFTVAVAIAAIIALVILASRIWMSGGTAAPAGLGTGGVEERWGVVSHWVKRWVGETFSEWANTGNLKRKRPTVWVLFLIVAVLLAYTGALLFATFQKTPSVGVQEFALFMVICNLLDWWPNREFFFGQRAV